jgi:hypothetical protein
MSNIHGLHSGKKKSTDNKDTEEFSVGGAQRYVIIHCCVIGRDTLAELYLQMYGDSRLTQFDSFFFFALPDVGVCLCFNVST